MVSVLRHSVSASVGNRSNALSVNQRHSLLLLLLSLLFFFFVTTHPI